jgi:MFS family permease
LASATLPSAEGGYVRVVGLISFGHFFAHLNVLVLPPLFPLLKGAFGVGYTELGLLLAVLNVTTLLTQAPIGALVDRLGAARILIVGHMALALAVTLVGVLPWYPALLLLMVLAGLGNAVYHPADYAILATAVPQRRAGRAFGIHTFGGYAGFAAAPIVTVGLAEPLGWRTALVVIGLAGILLGLLLVHCRGLLVSPRRAPTTARGDTRRLLTGAPVLWALVFFALLAMTQGGITGFSVAALGELEGLDLLAANMPLTAFLVMNALGVLAGGWAADHTERHGGVVAACFLVVALAAATVATVRLGLPLTVLVLAVAGFANGVVAPSRDMLVRRVTPEGASGRVFGFVTTGFNIGGILAPPLFGLALDGGSASLVFWLVAALSLGSLATVLATSTSGRRAATA